MRSEATVRRSSRARIARFLRGFFATRAAAAPSTRECSQRSPQTDHPGPSSQNPTAPRRRGACFRDLNTSLVKCLSSLTKTSLVYTRVYEPCTVHDTRLVAVRGSYTKAILYTSRIQGSYGVCSAQRHGHGTPHRRGGVPFSGNRVSPHRAPHTLPLCQPGFSDGVLKPSFYFVMQLGLQLLATGEGRCVCV